MIVGQQAKIACLMIPRMVVVAGLFAIMPVASATTNSLSLHDAVRSNDMTALATLITDSRSLDTQDENGWTALMVAAETGNTNATVMLLKAGASPDISDRLGRSALHLATSASAEISRSLIKTGADVNSRNAGGVTALMLAAGSERRDIVELLLDAGGRLDMKDYKGDSVVDWSRRSGNAEFTNELEQKFALVNSDAPETTGEEFAEEVFVDVKFPDWFNPSFLDLKDDLDDAVSAGKQGLMIFISTRRCSYCKAFIQNSLSQPDILRRVQTSFDVVGLEIFDDSEMTDPAGQSYRVKDFVSSIKAAFTPAFVFYGPNGKMLLKIVGYYPPDKFRTVLDYLEGQHYQRESLRSFTARKVDASSKVTKKIISDDKLFSTPPYILDRRTGPAQQPMLVLFEQPDCNSCERFHKGVLTDKPVRRLIGEFEAVHLDSSDKLTRLITPTGQAISPAQWYERLDLTYSPAIVFFDETGEEVMRLDSETRRFRMEGSLQLVLEKAYQKDAQLQRWRSDKAVQLFKLDQEM